MKSQTRSSSRTCLSTPGGEPRQPAGLRHPGRRTQLVHRRRVQTLSSDERDGGIEGITIVAEPPDDVDLCIALGGDGTILRGAEMTRGSGAPLLGVNLGHVGFLAEAEREDISSTVEHIVARTYTVEERMTLDDR